MGNQNGITAPSQRLEMHLLRTRDIEKAICKLHADKKELAFKRDDWQLNLSTALKRSAQVNRQDIAEQESTPAGELNSVDVTNSKRGDAQTRHGLHVQFKALAEEEPRKDPHNQKDRWLRAYVARDS